MFCGAWPLFYYSTKPTNIIGPCYNPELLWTNEQPIGFNEPKVQMERMQLWCVFKTYLALSNIHVKCNPLGINDNQYNNQWRNLLNEIGMQKEEALPIIGNLPLTAQSEVQFAIP